MDYDGCVMKTSGDYIEGHEASERFVAGMKTILSVPREEMQRREDEYKKQAALNPRKRGPKSKPKSSDPGPVV